MCFKNPRWIYDFRFDIYSQTGEDGVIQKILEILPKSKKQKWCVEFGAWDGYHFSNTRNLIEKNNYSAVLIEGNKKKFQQLQKNYINNNKVIPIKKFVGFEERDSLDVILKEIAIPRDYEFLSVDIDGNDYHVWKAIKKYRPKVICIEFNSTIPTEVRFVQEANLSVSQGASLLSLTELGKEKGYELLCVLHGNAFFVKAEFFPLFKIKDNKPKTLRVTDNITYLFSGYDGKIFLRGHVKLPWHQMALKESKLQYLPWYLRKNPTNYSIIEKAIYVLYLLCLSPQDFCTQIRRRFFCKVK